MPDLTELNRKIDKLSASADRLERRLRRGHQLVAVALVLIVILGGGVILGNRVVIERNNQNFCSYLASQAASDRGVVDPPNTAGRRQAEEAERLAERFSC